MLNGMEALHPRCFGVRGVVGKKAEVQKPNRVSGLRSQVSVPVSYSAIPIGERGLGLQAKSKVKSFNKALINN
jgi:hypothetical protein